MSAILSPLNKFFRKLLRPHVEFPLLQSFLYSPLDSLAERTGFESTEELFRTNAGARKLENALVKCLDGPRAGFALRKHYMRIWEHRLRAVALHFDPPQDHGYGRFDFGGLGHPLDSLAAEKLSNMDSRAGTLPKPGIKMKLANWLAIFGWGVALIFVPLLVLIRHGRISPPVKTVQLACPSALSHGSWELYKNLCEERGYWNEKSLLIVNERRSKIPEGISTVDPSAIKVPILPWIRRVLLPSYMLVGRCMLIALVHGRDLHIQELILSTLKLSLYAAEVWQMCFGVRCDRMVDGTEPSANHNIKAIIVRKFGGTLVRWPTTETEAPGFSYRYLEYDAFISGGTYLAETYGESWSPTCKPVHVGLLRNDRAYTQATDPGGQAAAMEIEARLAAGQKMAVFFGNNEIPAFNEAALLMFATLWDLIRDRDDWFIAIKPKKLRGKGGFFDRIYTDPRIAGFERSSDVVITDFPGDDNEAITTPPSWLIDRMDFGVTLLGSVQSESLTRGKRMLAFFPIIQETPMARTLMDHDLMFSDIDRLRQALLALLDGQARQNIPQEWAGKTWDGYCDDRAFARIIDYLHGSVISEPKLQ